MHRINRVYLLPKTTLHTTRLMSAANGRATMRPAVRRVCGPAISPMQPNSVQSRDGRCQLQIVAQPEQQHRARYQTEGSRGAVKDRSGNGFPVVKLTGYARAAVLEIFIGTDIGRVAPHMFYQACKVSGKNSTACVEKKHEGTIVIEIELKPETEWQVTCDCVGILKVGYGFCVCVCAMTLSNWLCLCVCVRFAPDRNATSMWSIGFRIKWHRAAKRSRHAVGWCFALCWSWTMAPQRRCRYARNRSFAVSRWFLFKLQL